MKLKEFGLVVLLFLLLTAIFSYKIFQGYIPLPTDLIVGAYHPWYGHHYNGYPLGVPVKNPKLSDAVSIFYPLKALAVDNIKSGELPLWNPYMFAGYPLFANVQLGLLFPTMIFYLMFPTTIGWTLQTLSQPFLAGIFMYLLLRHLKLNPLSSIFGGIAYGFGGFTILWMQWNTQATTSMMLPVLILLEDKYFQTRNIKWGILFSLFLCFQIFAGYLPVLPPTFMCLGIWYLFRPQNYFKDLSLGLFFVLGIALSAIFTIPVAELILNSQRGVETLGSQNPFTNPGNFLTLLAPDFFGNDATGNFWGIGDHMDSTLYVGITALLFAIIGIKEFFGKREIKFAVTILALAIFFSIENPISTFLYNLGVWGGTSITMNRINFVMNFAIALLSAYGISTLKNADFKLSIKPAIWTLAAIVGIFTGIFLSRYHLNNWLFLVKGDLVGDFNNMFAHMSISIKNLILPTAISFALLAVFLFFKFFKKLQRFAPILFILILTAELFRFGWKFNVFSEPEFAYPATNLTNYLQNFPNDRIVAEADILPANMWVPFKISSIAGYDGLYPLTMAKLLAVANSDDINAAPQPRWGTINKFNSGVLDASNTRFILATKLKEGVLSPEGKVNYLLQTPNLKEVYSDNFVAVLENQDRLPRAYLADKVIKASDSGMLAAIVDKSFPLENTAITESFEFNNPDATAGGIVDYQQITNSHVQIRTQTEKDTYLVVLDGFYPGWKAFVDNRETTIHRTNYAFNGIMLPAGDHTVNFRYQPDSILYGSLISSAALLMITTFLFTSSILKKNKQRS
jgi:hypothetical protein